MFCKYCGATLAENVKFCASCGAVASGSDERIVPKAAKSEFTHDKRDPREVFSNKGENYYTNDNSILNIDSTEDYTNQNRNNYVQKPIQYTENIGGNNPYISNGAVKPQNNKKKLGFAAKLLIFIVAVAAGVGIGFLITQFIL